MKNLIWLVVITFFIIGCSSSSEPNPDANTSEDIPPRNTGNDDDPAGSNNTPMGSITADNTNELILQAFDVLTARAYDARLTVFPYTQPIEIPVSYGENLTVRRLTPRACENSGQVTTIPETIDDRYQEQATYSDCLVGTETLNGSVTLFEDLADDPNDLSTLHRDAREFSDGFAVRFEPAGQMSVSGLYKLKSSTSFARMVGVENFNYDFSYPGGRLTVSDATTIRTFRMDGSSDNLGHITYMAGKFKMQPPVLNGAEVFVEVTEPFINQTSATQLSYESGVMRISNAGNELVVTANNGNADTVSITSTFDGGTPVTREEPWSVWMAALAFEAPDLRTTIPENPTTNRADLIRADNYTDILAEVFRVYNGERFGADILALPRYSFPEFEPGILNPNTLDGLGEPMTMSCTNGGNVELRTYKWGARQITGGWNARFDVCDQDGLRYEGSFYTRDFGNFNYGSVDGLSLTSDNSTQEFKGGLDYKHTTNRDGSPTVWYSLTGDYKVGDSRGDYELREASVFFGGVYSRTRLVTGRFYLKSPISENTFIQVQSADPIVYQGNDFNGIDGQFFEWGTLVISAGSGNRLTLKASNGNDDTFDVIVDQPGQPQLRVTHNWADWQQLLSFNFDLHRR